LRSKQTEKERSQNPFCSSETTDLSTAVGKVRVRPRAETAQRLRYALTTILLGRFLLLRLAGPDHDCDEEQ
jgi:hypothetical protein